MYNLPEIGSPYDQFFIAIKANDTETINRLLSENLVDPNNRLPEFRRYDSHNGTLSCHVTVLYAACYYGHLDTVSALLQHGADPNQAIMYGDTPLIEASDSNKPEIVDKLLSSGANPNLTNSYQKSALHAASYRGDTQSMSMLIDHGAMVNAVDSNGDTPLGKAIHSRSQEAFTLLLNKGASMNFGKDLSHSLASSVYKQTPENRIALIKAGLTPNRSTDSSPLADITSTISSSGSSTRALTRDFSEEEVYEIAEVLLNAGFDPNFKNPNTGMTPLSGAVFAGRPEVIALLVEHGARLTAPIRDGESLLTHHSITRRDEVETMIKNLEPVTSLQNACRLTIRKAIIDGKKPGESLISNTPLLPLPTPLKTYICNLN